VRKVKSKSPLAPLLQRGGLSVILGGCWLISRFQTGQQCAASVSPFEKRKQQRHCGALRKHSDLASPFVKGGLRGIFHYVILLPFNEETVV